MVWHSGDRVVLDDRQMNDDDRLLTVDELAEFLDLPVRTLYTWRYRGEGPVGFRVGKHIRYRWSDVDRWVRERVHAADARRQLDRLRTRAPSETPR